MTILATFDFESFAEGAPVTASSPWGKSAGSGVITAKAVAAKHGTMGAHPAPGEFCNLYYLDTSSAVRVASQYFSLTSVAATLRMARLMNSSTQRAGWVVEADRTVSILNGFANSGQSTVVLSYGVWYRAEWMVGTGVNTLRVYIGESTSPLLELTSTGIADGSHTSIHQMVQASSAGSDVYFDTLRIGDDWMGPHEPAPAPPTAIHGIGPGGVLVPMVSVPIT